METFIHTIADNLSLSTLAYSQKFDGLHDYLVIGSATKLNFYRFDNFETPVFKFSYQIFGDIALIIPYKTDYVSLLIVILSSTKFCVLHYENGQIVTDQNGSMTTCLGVDIGQKFSYSLYNSLLLVQIWQEKLQLHKIEKRKLIFIQNILLFTTSVYRFQLISPDEFIVIHNQMGANSYFDHYKFDLLTNKKVTHAVLPNIFNNFVRTKNKEYLISRSDFIELENGAIVTYMKVNLPEDIYDAYEIGKDLFLAVTVTGKIISIKRKEDGQSEIIFLDEIQRILKPVAVGKTQIIFPSKFGDTKFFQLINSQPSIRTLFSFSGTVKRFHEVSKRCILGLTQTNHLYRIEKSLSFDDDHEIQFEMKNRCWFINEELILFSSENMTRVLNIRNGSEEVNFPIQKDQETIGFRRFGEDHFVQITEKNVFFDQGMINQFFSHISLPTFSETSFAFCENSQNIFIFSFSGELLLQWNFPVQINSMCLFKNEILVVSSWESSSIAVFNLIRLDTEETQFTIEKTGEFENLSVVDISFINDGEMMLALSPKDEIHFLSIRDFSISSQFCEGMHCKLIQISNNEWLVSGEKFYLINEQVITEIKNEKQFLNFDVFRDQILLCNIDNSISIKRRKSNYQTQFNDVAFPRRIIDFVKYDDCKYSVIFEENKKEVKIAMTKDVLNFNGYQIDQENCFENGKFFSLITVKDAISELDFIVVLNSSELLSLSCKTDNRFVKTKSFVVNSKPVGLFNIEENIFGLVLSDKIYVFSLEDGDFKKLSMTDTNGSSNCFSYLNEKLIIGDYIESFIIYGFNNNSFKEIFRECHELNSASCLVVTDEIFFGCDSNSYIYQMRTVNQKNFSSKNIVIDKVVSFGSLGKIMIYCKDFNCVLIGTTNGEIVELKEIECTENFGELYNKIESSISTIGYFENASFRRCKCQGYYLGIPRIYDTGALILFSSIDDEQMQNICERKNINFDGVKDIIKRILDLL